MSGAPEGDFEVPSVPSHNVPASVLIGEVGEVSENLSPFFSLFFHPPQSRSVARGEKNNGDGQSLTILTALTEPAGRIAGVFGRGALVISSHFLHLVII